MRQLVWIAFSLLGLPSVWLALGMRSRGRASGGTTKEGSVRNSDDGEERVELISRDEMGRIQEERV